jgi:hypothetical protein
MAWKLYQINFALHEASREHLVGAINTNPGAHIVLQIIALLDVAPNCDYAELPKLGLHVGEPGNSRWRAIKLAT